VTSSPDVVGATDAPARPHASALVVGVLGAVLLLLAAAAVVGSLKAKEIDDRSASRAAALAAARQVAINLTSIDTTDIDADLKAVLDLATGGFRTDFAQRAEDLKKVLAANNVIAKGEVLEAALVRADDASATALVVVDSTVRNKAAPQGRANTYRMQLDLEKRNGRWLTSTLQFVG